MKHSHVIVREGRGGFCDTPGCELNLTFLSDRDVRYLESNGKCPAGAVKFQES